MFRQNICFKTTAVVAQWVNYEVSENFDCVYSNISIKWNWHWIIFNCYFTIFVHSLCIDTWQSCLLQQTLIIQWMVEYLNKQQHIPNIHNTFNHTEYISHLFTRKIYTEHICLSWDKPYVSKKLALNFKNRFLV